MTKTPMTTSSRRILLVEDNKGDALLAKMALQEVANDVIMDVVEDGAAALRFLDSCLESEDLPDLILLDLNLPKLSGHEVLGHIKNHEYLRLIPVLMLTTSQAEDDIIGSYSRYVNGYVAKPVDMDEFIAVMNAVCLFWFQTATLPMSR